MKFLLLSSSNIKKVSFQDWIERLIWHKRDVNWQGDGYPAWPHLWPWLWILNVWLFFVNSYIYLITSDSTWAHSMNMMILLLHKAMIGIPGWHYKRRRFYHRHSSHNLVLHIFISYTVIWPENIFVKLHILEWKRNLGLLWCSGYLPEKQCH